MIRLERIERVYAALDVTATLPDGTPAVVSSVDVVLLPLSSKPAAATTWTAATYTDDVATVLLAGPDAATDGALTVPEAGADLWIRVVDSPEVTVAHVARINIS